MKRPFLVLFAVAASLGFGAWLVRTPHSLREILTACAAWVLGFWAAAAIQARGRRRDIAREDGDDASWDEDEDGEEEDDEEVDEEADEDAWEDDR